MRSPGRRRLDLPSRRATRSSASSTHSRVWPRTNSPGWRMNGSSSPTWSSSVRSGCGARTSMYAYRLFRKTRKLWSRWRSTDDGCRSALSYGSIRTLPFSISVLMSRSERTLTAAMLLRPVGHTRSLGKERVDLALEVLEIFEALVHRREPDVGDVVDRPKLLHGEGADP